VCSSDLIPVIFLSGLLDPQEKVKAFRAGAVDYVAKPFHLEEVEARVRTHLALRRQRRDLEERTEELRRTLFQTEVMNRNFIDMNEKLRRSEALKGRFLALMRNELNDPLNALLALSAEIAGDQVPAERIHSVAELIAAEACSLDFKMRNIFCAAELEAGESCPSISQVEVQTVLRDALGAFRYEAREQQVVLGLDAERCGAFPTDAAMLRIIAANLVSNGIKFGGRGGRLRVRASAGPESLRLEVEDEGPGIPAKDQAAAFEQFRQLDSGLTRAHKGQGLGLSVAKALAELLGGEIRVASQEGRGACFTCLLPRGVQATDASSRDGNLFFFGDAEER
jgi:signal transduction histidine kinase